MIGSTISHYKIVEKLGEGGMGVVYKAYDERLERYVALKIPPDKLLYDERIQSRFLHEARMAAEFVHQNIAILHDIGDHEGHPYIVMEYVDGPTLKDLIGSGGPLSIERFLKLAIQMCSAIEAVHEKNVLHRDIKTENILLTSKEQVKIADCGLAARFVARENLAGRLTIAGTPAYMSPEQIRGEQPDQRSDIFSLGVVFYEMLAGKRPFEAQQAEALSYLIVNVDPTPLSELRKNVPREITDIISKALVKEREKRYQQVHEMIHDLWKIELSISQNKHTLSGGNSQ